MIDQEQNGDATWLVFAHGKANVMDLESCTALAVQFEALAAGVGPVVITGRDRIFSAGVDLKRILEGGDEYVAAFLPALERMLRAVILCPRPVVAGINGHAIAGGCVLACAADLALMADGGGRIGVPELAVGVPFPPMAFEVMRAAVPAHRRNEVILGAGTYRPDEALAIGLIDGVTAADTLESQVLAQCERLGAIPSTSYATTKAALNADVLDRAARNDLDQTISQWCSDPVRSAIQHYVEVTLKAR
jgi:enoyl-CoA hydratase/carnithine racemase